MTLGCNREQCLVLDDSNQVSFVRIFQLEHMSKSIIKYSIALQGHRTSVSLEPEFWGELKRIAISHGKSINTIVGQIDNCRQGNLSSAIRVFILEEATKRLDTNAKI